MEMQRFWLTDWVTARVSERVNEWMTEWMNDWMKYCELHVSLALEKVTFYCVCVVVVVVAAAIVSSFRLCLFA